MASEKYYSDVELLQLILKQLEILNKKLPLQEKPQSSQLGYIDNAELLQMLHITNRTAIKWRQNGTLKFSKINGKIFYKLSDLEETLGARQ